MACYVVSAVIFTVSTVFHKDQLFMLSVKHRSCVGLGKARSVLEDSFPVRCDSLGMLLEVLSIYIYIH